MLYNNVFCVLLIFLHYIQHKFSNISLYVVTAVENMLFAFFMKSRYLSFCSEFNIEYDNTDILTLKKYT